MAQMPDLELPDFINPSWGPTDDTLPSFSGLPYIPFSKRETISYIADWESTDPKRNSRSNAGGNKPNVSAVTSLDESAAVLDLGTDEEPDSFRAITIHKKPQQIQPKYKRDQTKRLTKISDTHRRLGIKEQKQLVSAPKTTARKKKQLISRARKRKYIENPRPNVPSLAKSDEWVDVKDIWFHDTFQVNDTQNFIFKIDGEESVGQVYEPNVECLLQSGALHAVLTTYDMTNAVRKKVGHLSCDLFPDNKFISFQHKAATQDTYLMQLASKKKGNIYTTDNVMTAIMCCNRSKYSFDIIITKIGDTIFLDERNKILSQFHVDETSQHRPTKNIGGAHNYYLNLAEEATWINRIFMEQMVYHNVQQFTQKLQRQHPFQSELVKMVKEQKLNKKNSQQTKSQNEAQSEWVQELDDNAECASQAFMYNLYDVSDNINVVCRCAVDGYVPKPGSKKKSDCEWAIIRALNQFDPSRSRTMPWIKYLKSRDSTILNKEIVNNNFKCARWAMQAHLAQAKYLKLGFVVREDTHSLEKHLICGVKTYETNDFLKNRLRIKSVNVPWTIFAKFIRCVQNLEGDGRFVALRDPLRQVIRIYRVQNDAFSEPDNGGLATFAQLKKTLGIKEETESPTKVM